MINEKILVPIDFSECSISALKVAIGIAEQLGNDLLILHTYHLSVVEGQYGVGVLAERMANDKKNEIEAQFKTLEEKVLELPNVTYELLSRHGNIDEEIFSICDSTNVYMVVMGTKGTSGIDEILIGSNAYSVTKEIKVPVLLIPENSSLKEIRNIALAGDYQPMEEQVLGPLKHIASLYHSTIFIIHISKEPVLKETEVDQAMKFEQYFKDIKHKYRLLIGEDVETGIRDYCDTHKIDLLTIIPRQRQLIDTIFGRSDTKKIVFHTQLPVLILPETNQSL